MAISMEVTLKCLWAVLYSILIKIRWGIQKNRSSILKINRSPFGGVFLSRDQFRIFKPHQPASHFKAYWILSTLCGLIFFISLTVQKILMKTCEFLKCCWIDILDSRIYPVYVRKNRYFSNANCPETTKAM